MACLVATDVGASRLHTEVVIFQIDVEIRQDQLVLDKLHMMRAISSPSSSTTGFATLIFAIAVTLGSTGRGDHKGRFTRRQADRNLAGTAFGLSPELLKP